MIFLPLETELFYYEHLLDSSDNLQLIQDFCVTNNSGYGLERYIKELGCATEDEARARVGELKAQHKYPVYFFKSDTTGEKDFEEFYTENETIVMDKFDSLGVIKNEINYEEEKLQHFTNTIAAMKKKGEWTRGELIDLFN